MKARVACPDCGYAFDVSEQHIGKPVQFSCPECETVQTVTDEKKTAEVVWSEPEEEDTEPGDEQDRPRPGVVFDEAPAQTNPAKAPAAPEPKLEPEHATEPEGPHCELGEQTPAETTPAEAAVEQDARSATPAPQSAEQEVQEPPADVSFPELTEGGHYELEEDERRGLRTAEQDLARADIQQLEVEKELFEPDIVEQELVEPEVMEEEELLDPKVIESDAEPDLPESPREHGDQQARKHLRAELKSIEYRMKEIRSKMSTDGAWSAEDARTVLEMPTEGHGATMRRLAALLFSPRHGYLIPCRSGPDGSPTSVSPSRVQEYKDLDMRRHVLLSLAHSGGLLPQVLLFTGPGLLGWLVLLFFVLLAQALTTLSAVLGTVALVPGVLAAVVLYRALFRPLRGVLKQYPLWKPSGFAAPGRRIYRVMCMFAIAGCCVLVALVIASHLI